MTGFMVLHGGILSLLQDSGRFGQTAFGLTCGGPMDPSSAQWANRLLQNPLHATLIECSIGGLKLQAQLNSFICITGATLPVTINSELQPQWSVLPVKAGDVIELGMVSQGQRAYLAVAGGFNIATQFGSTATVLREGIGGLNGSKLQSGDSLPASPCQSKVTWRLPEQYQPKFTRTLTLRVVEGYQIDSFSTESREQFYQHCYRVTPQADRMGYKLQGAAITCRDEPLLSEGICYGAIQVPPDGQPIVLLNDRQTLGGYPKLGSVLSLDCALLAQASTGTEIYFMPISVQQAQHALRLAKVRTDAIANTLEPI